MKELLNQAKEDLEISQLLYENKKYSNALYHFHQSVEKSVKSIGLSIGGINSKQLQSDIRHNPIKVFKHLFKYFASNSGGFLNDPDPHLFTKAKGIIDSRTEEDVIEEVSNMLKSIYDEPKNINEEEYSSPLDAFCSYVNKVLPEIDLKLDSEYNRKQVELRLGNDIINTINIINYGTKILQILLTNSLLCCRFRPDEFRYSSEKFGNPVDYFNENNPIVKELEFLISSMSIPVKFGLEIKWGMKSN